MDIISTHSRNQFRNKTSGFCELLVVLVLLAGLQSTVYAQVTSELRVNSEASGQAYSASVGETVTLNCSYNQNASLVTFERNVAGSYENLTQYQYGSGLVSGFGSYAGGAITGQSAADDLSYEITLPNLSVADSGTYMCLVESQGGDTPASDPTVDISVEDPCSTNPCINGTCNVENGATYSCTCDDGYTGNTCDTLILCSNDPCQNGGTCLEEVNATLPSDYSCTCTDCFSGTHCETEIQNACSASPCENGAECTNLCTSFECTCLTGFTGANCSVNIDDCAAAADPCQNGGTCEDGINGYNCTCLECFNGTHCETEISNPCDSDPCTNGGTCSQQCPNFQCACPDSWRGETCELASCSPNPCINGYCNETETDIVCTCDEDYTGSLCESKISPCFSEPCLNGGTCVEDADMTNYTCTCPVCYNGTTCENEIVDPCKNNPCQNGGTCVKDCTNYSCLCPINYQGTNCTSACSTVANITQKKDYYLDSDVTLTCEPKSPSSTTYWSLDVTGTPRLVSDKSYDLMQVSPEDTKTYFCFVSDSTCTQRRSTSFGVFWEISPNETEYFNATWTEDESESLGCSASSTPHSTLVWYFTPAVDIVQSNENVTASPPASPRNLSATQTNTSLMVTVDPVTTEDAGIYQCVAEFPHGVTAVVKQYSVTVVSDDDDEAGLPWWVILLIVLACIIVLLLVVGLPVYFCCIKNHKVGVLCGNDKYASSDMPEKHQESKLDSSYDRGATERSSGRQSQRSPAHTKSKVRYEDEEEESRRDPRPLPEARGRAQSLQPLDVEGERKKIQKKKKKKKARQPTHHEEEGGEDEGGYRMKDSSAYYDQDGGNNEYSEYRSY